MKFITNLNESERMTGRDNGPISDNPLSSQPIHSHSVYMFWRRVRHIQEIKCEKTFKPTNSESASVQVHHSRKCNGRIEQEATYQRSSILLRCLVLYSTNYKMFGVKRWNKALKLRHVVFYTVYQSEWTNDSSALTFLFFERNTFDINNEHHPHLTTASLLDSHSVASFYCGHDSNSNIRMTDRY